VLVLVLVLVLVRVVWSVLALVWSVLARAFIASLTWSHRFEVCSCVCTHKSVGVQGMRANCGSYCGLQAVTQANVDRYLHLVYGLSKDWCASGLRVGVMYSRNTLVNQVGREIQRREHPSTVALSRNFHDLLEHVWARTCIFFSPAILLHPYPPTNPPTPLPRRPWAAWVLLSLPATTSSMRSPPRSQTWTGVIPLSLQIKRFSLIHTLLWRSSCRLQASPSPPQWQACLCGWTSGGWVAREGVG
jgi:hypothetical protein